MHELELVNKKEIWGITEHKEGLQALLKQLRTSGFSTACDGLLPKIDEPENPRRGGFQNWSTQKKEIIAYEKGSASLCSQANG